MITCENCKYFVDGKCQDVTEWVSTEGEVCCRYNLGALQVDKIGISEKYLKFKKAKTQLRHAQRMVNAMAKTIEEAYQTIIEMEGEMK